MPMLSLKHFLLRAEGKALYRDTLRALRGVDAATAQSIRESARAMYADNAAESDPDRIRVLLIDGRCVRPLPISLRCAQIERWALPPTFHSPPTHLPLAAHPPPTHLPPTSHPPPTNNLSARRHSLKEMCQCLGTAVVRPEANVSDTPTPTSAVSSNGRSSVSRK